MAEHLEKLKSRTIELKDLGMVYNMELNQRILHYNNKIIQDKQFDDYHIGGKSIQKHIKREKHLKNVLQERRR